MNFIPGTVAVDGGGPALHLDAGGKLDLKGIEGHIPKAGARARIGVRPEKLHLHPANRGHAGLLRATVVAEVYVGSTLLVHLDLGRGTQIRARVPAGRQSSSWGMGEPVSLSWDPGDARLFADQAASPPGA
jgi:putative spermidine/putrescine transport system ATP-binding protein